MPVLLGSPSTRHVADAPLQIGGSGGLAHDPRQAMRDARERVRAGGRAGVASRSPSCAVPGSAPFARHRQRGLAEGVFTCVGGSTKLSGDAREKAIQATAPTANAINKAIIYLNAGRDLRRLDV